MPTSVEIAADDAILASESFRPVGNVLPRETPPRGIGFIRDVDREKGARTVGEPGLDDPRGNFRRRWQHTCWEPGGHKDDVLAVWISTEGLMDKPVIGEDSLKLPSHRGPEFVQDDNVRGAFNEFDCDRGHPLMTASVQNIPGDDSHGGLPA